MKTLSNIISAFVCLNIISTVLTYYIYDDNPTGGFVPVDHEVGYVGLSALQRKHFSGPMKFQKVDSNEHIVDSHFRVTKMDGISSPTIQAENRQEHHESPAYVEPTKNSKVQATNERPEGIPKQENRRINEEEHRDLKPQMENKSRRIPKSQANIRQRNNDFNHQMLNQVRPGYQRETHENNRNLVELNVRKTQISTDPQKVVRLNNNRQLIAMSERGPITRAGYQRGVPSPIVDKTLHKTSFSERNSQIMARVLNDMAYKTSDKRIKGEYLKRDTNSTYNEEIFKSKRNVISDTMRKYIGKDKNMVKDQIKRSEVLRIGSLQEKIDDTPYALFYRMNPQTLDQQDDFIVINNNGNPENEFETNNKVLTVGHDNEVYVGRPKTANNVKRHKKLKNFSSFHSY